MSVSTGVATRVAENPYAEGLARGVALSYEKTEVRVPGRWGWRGGGRAMLVYLTVGHDR